MCFFKKKSKVFFPIVMSKSNMLGRHAGWARGAHSACPVGKGMFGTSVPELPARGRVRNNQKAFMPNRPHEKVDNTYFIDLEAFWVK